MAERMTPNPRFLQHADGTQAVLLPGWRCWLVPDADVEGQTRYVPDEELGEGWSEARLTTEECDAEPIGTLIERSSLGTPEAKANRESIPVEEARAVVRRAFLNEAGDQEDASWFMVTGWLSAHLPGRYGTLCGRQVRGEVAPQVLVPRCGQCLRRSTAQRQASNG